MLVEEVGDDLASILRRVTVKNNLPAINQYTVAECTRHAPLALAVYLVLGKDDVLAGEKETSTPGRSENVLLGGVLVAVSALSISSAKGTFPVKLRDGQRVSRAGRLEGVGGSGLLVRLVCWPRIEFLLLSGQSTAKHPHHCGEKTPQALTMTGSGLCS